MTSVENRHVCNELKQTQVEILSVLKHTTLLYNYIYIDYVTVDIQYGSYINSH